jgi:hypothetical protein
MRFHNQVWIVFQIVSVIAIGGVYGLILDTRYWMLDAG